jgi:type I restriction enzyme S subunit
MKWPQGWREVSILDVCQLNPRISQDDWLSDDTMVSFVPMSAIDEDRGVIASIEERPLSEVKKGYTPFLEGDVLFAKVTPCMENGKAAIAGGLRHGIGFGSTEFHVLRPNTDLIAPEYVLQFVRQPWFRERAASAFVGTGGLQRVPSGFFQRVRLPLPPLPEQQRIVEVLREADLQPFYAAADKAKALREALVAAFGRSGAWYGSDFDEVREASLRRNELLGIERQTSSHEWPTVPLLAVCELNPKLHPDERPAADALVTFVPMAAVDEHLAAITTPEVRPYAEVQKGYTAFAEGDVLFAKVTPCMENGKAAVASNLIGGVGFGSTEFHVLRPDTRLILAEYLLHFVRQPQFREQAKAAFVGTGGLQRVPPDFFKRVRLPLPSIPEQRRIVDALKQVAPQSFHSAISQAKRLQSALITEALSGRLTAAWREQNAERLAAAARERDARLGAPPGKVTGQITEHNAAERRTDLAQPRRQALIEQLSGFQHAVWDTLRHEWRGAVLADDPAVFDEFCTSPQTAWRLEGFAAGREEVRRALEQLAALGLIRKMSLPRANPHTGRTEYLTAFRPLREAQDGGRAEEDTALADAERLVRELQRRRAPEAR